MSLDLHELWKRRRVQAAPGCSEAELAAFERRWDVKLPEAVRAYLRLANGTIGLDNQGFAFVPLERWERAGDELRRMGVGTFDGADTVFLFVDYLCWSWMYGLWLGEGPRWGSVWLISGGAQDFEIAPDLERFFALYRTDDRALYGA
jgi:SMI1 / KNR4 family (SUKH-1)